MFKNKFLKLSIASSLMFGFACAQAGFVRDALDAGKIIEKKIAETVRGITSVTDKMVNIAKFTWDNKIGIGFALLSAAVLCVLAKKGINNVNLWRKKKSFSDFKREIEGLVGEDSNDAKINEKIKSFCENFQYKLLNPAERNQLLDFMIKLGSFCSDDNQKFGNSLKVIAPFVAKVAAQDDNIVALKSFIQKVYRDNMDADYEAEILKPMLLVACELKNSQMVKVLVENGAPVDQDMLTKFGTTKEGIKDILTAFFRGSNENAIPLRLKLAGDIDGYAIAKDNCTSDGQKEKMVKLLGNRTGDALETVFARSIWKESKGLVSSKETAFATLVNSADKEGKEYVSSKEMEKLVAFGNIAHKKMLKTIKKVNANQEKDGKKAYFKKEKTVQD